MNTLAILRSTLTSYFSKTDAPSIMGICDKDAIQKPPTEEPPPPPKKPDTKKPPTHHKPGGYKLYKRLFLLGCIPAIGLMLANVFYLNAHEPERAEFIKYSYLRKRDKRFPWGDGQKSLFHNEHLNALPGGYEDEVKAAEEEATDGKTEEGKAEEGKAEEGKAEKGKAEEVAEEVKAKE